MSIGDWFRRLFSSHAESAEEAAAEHEEYGAPDQGEADIERMAETGQVDSRSELLYGSGNRSSFGASEAAGAAEADLESEEAPPDPNP